MTADRGLALELSGEAAADYSWSISTSHRAGPRNLVPVICDTLGLLAFDGQANLLIWPAVPGA